MINNSYSRNTYRFGEYCLSGLTEQLSYKNVHIKLEPQLFNLLLVLVSNYGEVVDRQQIQDAVWAGRPVSDEAIRVAIKKLRDIFADDAKAPLFIKTLPRQGYRWLAPVDVNKIDNNKQAGTFAIKRVFFWGFLGVIILYLGLFIFWTQFSVQNQTTKNSQSSVTIEVLTSLPGSEGYADYHQADNKLAFLHRDARNSPQQLYVKNLDSGLVKRLSWDMANYSNAAWSKDGKT
ncbi:MAG: DNA-binding winged helix-turn-helix (wHTH) protein [Alphaproteobacteria bacterium]|jgi:DNA-binding winged helix-turn-helix (wHTH) protein